MEIKSSIQAFDLSALKYTQLFSCLGFHFSPCLHARINFHGLATTAFFWWPWLLASSFPRNTDTHLFQSIDVPVVTDSFGGKSKLNEPVGTKMRGSGGVAGRKKWWERVFCLTDHKTFSSNIF